MDTSFRAAFNNSPQRHSIVVLPPEEWVVGSEEQDSKAPPPHSITASHNTKSGDYSHFLSVFSKVNQSMPGLVRMTRSLPHAGAEREVLWVNAAM